MPESIMALDLGTSSVCCILTDLNLGLLAVRQAPMDIYTPPDCSSLGREFDPDRLMSTMAQLVSAIGGGADVIAIGITSQRQAVVFLDANGSEMYCSPNLDMRAVFEGAAIDESWGAEVYHLSGHYPSLMFASARLGWLKENRPAQFGRLRWVLPLASWMSYRLTGNVVSEPSIDAEAGLVDIHTRDRIASLESLGGPSPCHLPPLVPAGCAAGELREDIASKWGLKAGIPVAIGGPDTQCGLMGLGLAKKRHTGAILGWSGCLQTTTDRPCLDDDMRTWAGCHPVEDVWVAEANLGDTGNAYGWLKDLLLGEEEPFDRAEVMAAAQSRGADGVVGLLGSGPDTAPRSGLRTGGLLFPIPLAFQRANAGQLFRAALEHVAFSVKSNLATLKQVTKVETGTLHVAGGMAGSKTLLQVLADVTGAEVAANAFGEASGRGAAAAGAVAAGVIPSLEDAADMMYAPTRMYQPDPSAVAEYVEHYQRWMELYRNVR